MAGQADELCAEAPMVVPPHRTNSAATPRNCHRLAYLLRCSCGCRCVLCVCGKPPIASRGIGEEPIIFDEGALLLRLQAMKLVKARIALVSNSNVSS